MSSLLSPKAVIVGLDGATFDLLLPLVDEGVMPNLGNLLADGAHGRLISTIPPTTAPAWTTFTTGVNPGRHGVFDFRSRINGDVQWVSSRSVRAPRIWDIANAVSQSAGVINMPLTYPPTPIQGYMVSGFMTPSKSKSYTHPSDLHKQLEQAIGEYVIYEPIPPKRSDKIEEIEAYLHRTRHMVTQRAKALYWLMSSQPTDLVMIVFQVLDTLQHLFWKFLDPRQPAYNSETANAARPMLLDCYRQVDDILGDIRDRLDQNAYLILGSDHGFGPFDRSFLINEWLAQQGFLEYSRPRLIAEKVIRRVRNLLRQSRAGAPLIEQTTRFVPDHKSSIEWKKTRAFSGETHQQAIYVNVRGREPEGYVEPGAAYEAVRSQIIAQLDELCDPVTGQHIPTQVFRREEIYSGPFVQEAPDLALVLDNYNCQVSARFSLRGRYLSHQPLPMGTHRRDGILLIHGPGVRAGHDIGTASITDVMPTTLHLIGSAVPEGLDGRVLVETLDDAWVQNHPVRYQSLEVISDTLDGATYSKTEATEIESRLRGLGYLE